MYSHLFIRKQHCILDDYRQLCSADMSISCSIVFCFSCLDGPISDFPCVVSLSLCSNFNMHCFKLRSGSTKSWSILGYTQHQSKLSIIPNHLLNPRFHGTHMPVKSFSSLLVIVFWSLRRMLWNLTQHSRGLWGDLVNWYIDHLVSFELPDCRLNSCCALHLLVHTASVGHSATNCLVACAVRLSLVG